MAEPQRHAGLLLELADLRDELDERVGDRDVSVAVERELRLATRSPRGSRWSRPKRLVIVIVAAGVGVVAVPPAWAAVRSLFRVGAITVEPSEVPAPTLTTTTPAAPATAGPDMRPLASLGSLVTLDEARRAAPILVPTMPGLTQPDQVRLDTDDRPHVSLLYRAGPGRPEIKDSDGAGLIIEEFHADGSEMMRKYLQPETNFEAVDINGSEAVFLSGGRHNVWYVDKNGNDRTETGRSVGNALIFHRGGLTIRIEGDLDKAQMTEIARSLQ